MSASSSARAPVEEAGVNGSSVSGAIEAVGSSKSKPDNPSSSGEAVGAARELQMTQAAVSYAIHRLEEHLGIALFLFGSGPVRGFAVVHCLGILTSMFSAVFVSRGIVALVYGGRKKLDKISIGQVWRPQGAAPAAPTKA